MPQDFPMTRLTRIDLPFCLYHVFSRTIGLKHIDDVAFHDIKDKNKFLDYVERYSGLFSFRIHAWCLMSTHFHLLLESTEQAVLSEFMRRLLTAYTVYFNRRHDRHGHLFQGRFHSLIIDKATHLLAVSRYIHLNPVKTTKPANPETYACSSLKYYLKGGEPSYLYTKETLDWFGGEREKYGEFVRKGLTEETALPIHFRRFVGDPSFGERMGKLLVWGSTKGSRAEKAKRLRKYKERQKADDICDIVAGHFHLSSQAIKSGRSAHGITGVARTLSMILLREKLPWTYREIADFMNIYWISGVTRRVFNQGENKEILQHLNIIRKKFH